MRLKDKFTRLFHLECNKNVSVKERGEWEGERWVWKWDWRREPRGRVIGELREIEETLHTKAPKRDMRDKTVWSLDSQNGFSVKRIRELLEEKREEGMSTSTETRWIKSIPKKINMFMWRVRHGRIPTKELLDKWRMDLGSLLCPRCGKCVETLDQALITCEEMKTWWRLVGKWWNINLDSLNSVNELLETDRQEGINMGSKEKWMATIWCLIYIIWNHRNKVIFEQDQSKITDRFFAAQIKVFEWIKNRDRSQNLDWNTWIASPDLLS